MTKIQEMSNKSTQLTDAEKRIISFELKRRNSDAFSDKDSFYEYVDLLSVVSSGKIDNYQYKNFRLFPIKARTELTNFSEKQIDNYLKQNKRIVYKVTTDYIHLSAYLIQDWRLHLTCIAITIIF